MNNVHTTGWKGRITKQGLRDLNSYGPRGTKGVAGATVADEKVAPEERPTVTSVIQSHDKDAIK